jgi:hypothetical protein
MKLELGLPIRMAVFTALNIASQLGNLSQLVIDTGVCAVFYTKNMYTSCRAVLVTGSLLSSRSRQTCKPSLLTWLFARFGRAYVMQLVPGYGGGS